MPPAAVSPLAPVSDGVRVALRVTPRASRAGVAGLGQRFPDLAGGREVGALVGGVAFLEGAPEGRRGEGRHEPRHQPQDHDGPGDGS